MSFEFPIQALATYCETFLATKATEEDPDETPAGHEFGKRGLAAHGKAPRYVWIPTRSRETKAGTGRQVTEVQTLASHHHHFEIHCWGQTYAQTWAMVNNIYLALDDAAKVDCRHENGRWAHPSEAWNQSGELYILEMSLRSPMLAQYVNLSTLADPASDQVLPTTYTGQTQSTDDLEVDGEAGPLVDTDDP